MAAQSPVKSPGASGGGQPVDYSFRELKSVSDLIFETPVTGHARRPPVNGDTRVDDYLESIVADGPKNGARLNANSVRLCNNQLTSLQGLDKALYHVLDDPRELVWLDASCCKLQGIDDIITQFPNLQARAWVCVLSFVQLSSVHVAEQGAWSMHVHHMVKCSFLLVIVSKFSMQNKCTHACT
mmetsp:Transcript_32180/g.96087  ORF Transcript_32180/g.96087 Transcript_32180/m.96087 type:complete len:183 (-) Transcript_32180:429-977(-)